MTAPGWYPDSQGNTRYWDGNAWAESDQTAVQPAVPAFISPPGPPSRPTSTRKERNIPLWIPILVGVTALFAGIAAGAATGKSTTKTVAGPRTTATATVNSTVTATPTIVKTIATKSFTETATYTPPAVAAFSDGTYRVGSEVKPGTYHTDGNPSGGGCYWERDSRGSPPNDIIANDNITGPTTLDIMSSDFAFKTTGGCDWTKIG